VHVKDNITDGPVDLDTIRSNCCGQGLQGLACHIRNASQINPGSMMFIKKVSQVTGFSPTCEPIHESEEY
jgi:hypothetical protein